MSVRGLYDERTINRLPAIAAGAHFNFTGLQAQQSLCAVKCDINTGIGTEVHTRAIGQLNFAVLAFYGPVIRIHCSPRRMTIRKIADRGRRH
ncbi:hypothetical protein D3C81_2030130 [compost metagenome]